MERNPFLETPRNSPQERRDSLVKGILQREALLGDIRQRLDKIPADADLGQIEPVLADIRVMARKTMGKAVCADYARMHKDMTESDRLFVTMKSEEDYSASYERILALKNEIISLLDRPDISFLQSIDNLVKSLKAKAKQVHALRHDRPKTLETLNKIRRSKSTGEEKSAGRIRDEDVVDIAYTPFEIAITLDAGYIGRIHEIEGFNYYGVHMSNTPFSLIDGGSPDQEGTRRHESVHNMLDGQDFASVRKLDEVFEQFRKSQLREQEFLRLLGLNDFKDNTPPVLLDRLKDEILANLESAEKTNFGTRRKKPTDYFLSAGWRAHSSKYHSTAGFQYRDFLDKVWDFSNKTSDPELKKYLSELSIGLQSLFLGMARDLDTAFGTAKRLPESEAAHDTLANLCLMLKPSQYSHLTDLLGKKFGTETCAKIAESVRFSRAIQSQDWESLPGLAVPAYLHPMDLQLIREFLKNSDAYDVGEDIITVLEVHSLDEYRRVTKFLTNLEKAVGASPELSEVAKRTAGEFFYRQAQGDMLDGFKDTIANYPKLDAAEKESQRDGFDVYFDAGLLSDDLSREFSPEEIEDWSREIDWPFFEQLGLQDKLRNTIKQAVIESAAEDARFQAEQAAAKKDGNA